MVASAFGFVLELVPGTTPKKPYSGLTAHGPPVGTDPHPCDVIPHGYLVEIALGMNSQNILFKGRPGTYVYKLVPQA